MPMASQRHGPWAAIALGLLSVPCQGLAQSEPPRSPIRSTAILATPHHAASPTPVLLRAAFRSGWADDRDNGALWSGRGLSAILRFGVSAHYGPVRLVFAPEFTWTANGQFPLADPVPGYSMYATPWFPMVDTPRRWGPGAAYEKHLGQSVVELGWRGVAVGFTSQNLIRGPEARYPIVLGASAPGVPSAFLSAQGQAGPLGEVRIRLRYGLLRESPYYDSIPDNNSLLHTLLSLDWEPGPLPGLTLGVSFSYRDPLVRGFSLDMLGHPFGSRSAQTPEQLAEDAMAAAHARWASRAVQVWGTWARADGALDVEDLLTDSDHSQLWAVGARTYWTSGGVRSSLTGEAASSAGRNLRQPGGGVTSTLRHGMAPQGHTHYGQPLGPSIGPGARAWWVELRRTAPEGPTLGAEIEHITRDLDVHWEVFRRRDGSDGEDREWRFGLLYEGPVPRLDWPGLSMKANGGLSLRWNRDYIQYSSNAHLVGPRESQVFLDLALTWDPNVKRRPQPEPGG